MNKIIERIDYQLKISGKKQSDLCNYIGITNQKYHAWKIRNTIPKATDLYNIAKFFNISIEYLITGEKKTKNINFISDKLNTEGKEKLIEQAEFLLSKYKKS